VKNINRKKERSKQRKRREDGKKGRKLEKNRFISLIKQFHYWCSTLNKKKKMKKTDSNSDIYSKRDFNPPGNTEN